MNIGFLGLGKLGLPVSLAVQDKGHNIFGYDISSQTLDDIKNKRIRYKEEWVEKLLPKTKLQINNIDDLVNKLEKFKKDKKTGKKIAKKGRDKYFKYFNSNIVSDYIISKTFDVKSKYEFIW